MTQQTIGPQTNAERVAEERFLDHAVAAMQVNVKAPYNVYPVVNEEYLRDLAREVTRLARQHYPCPPTQPKEPNA
jgi:hypothetical protein